MQRIPHGQQKNFSYGLITLGIVFFFVSAILLVLFLQPPQRTWKFQSIDTMKHSRDLARQQLSQTNPTTIDVEVKQIAETGATHVAIATPYDEEFLPVLRQWVVAARKNNLKVWLRGNFSGWEGWFDYPKITRDEHLQKTMDFLQKNSALFEDGDIFTACPECENGGPGDPRITRDVKGHREFLVKEYQQTRDFFKSIGKNVATNYDSMNYDVAKLIMDKETTSRLGGVVTIDHYVKSPEKINSDINSLAESSNGEIVLGEFGAPVPDITGNMSEVEQQEWVQKVLQTLSQNPNVTGVNYWVDWGGSTALWNQDGTPRAAVSIIKKYYTL